MTTAVYENLDAVSGIAKMWHKVDSRHTLHSRFLSDEDTEAGTAFIIEEGKAAVLIDPGKFNNISRYLLAGDVYLHEPGLGPVALKAISDVKYTVMSAKQFNSELTRDPIFAKQVMFNLQDQLVKSQGRAAAQQSRSVRERLIRQLIESSCHCDAITHPEGIMIKVKRSELGSAINATREMASRVLRDLESEGYVASDGHSIILLRKPQSDGSGTKPKIRTSLEPSDKEAERRAECKAIESLLRMARQINAKTEADGILIPIPRTRLSLRAGVPDYFLKELLQRYSTMGLIRFHSNGIVLKQTSNVIGLVAYKRQCAMPLRLEDIWLNN